jgi:2-polyprenyl-6-methoxyphenol hydroxylase-like FAD-dependent oxidoreductase
MTPRVLIVGGGFAGLAAALALEKAGFKPRVFERYCEPTEVAAGVSLWGNAIRALSKLGLSRRVIDAGDIITTATLLTWRGRTISTCDIGEADRKLGYPSIVIHRQDLLRILHEALPPGVLTCNAAAVQVRQVPGAEGRVILHTSDGRHHVAPVLVGADGNRSLVRTQMVGREELRYSGYTCWRGVLELPTTRWPSGHAAEVWGRGQRFGITRLDSRRMYWWATRNAPPNGRDADPQRTLRACFKGWVDPIPDIIRQTDPRTILRTDIYDRPPTRRWGEGRVTTIGDAAHAPTPNLGQGACMVFEDAVVLAKWLGEAAAGRMEAAAARRAEARARSAPTAMVTKVSWRLGAVGQWTNPVLCALRDFATSLTPRFMFLQNHRSVVGFEAG